MLVQMFPFSSNFLLQHVYVMWLNGIAMQIDRGPPQFGMEQTAMGLFW